MAFENKRDALGLCRQYLITTNRLHLLACSLYFTGGAIVKGNLTLLDIQYKYSITG